MASARNLEDLEQQETPTPILETPLTNPGPRGANRRFVPRMSARFIVRNRDGGPSYEGVDISFGGLMATGGPPTWPGNLLDLDLILPGEHSPVRVRGHVVELVNYRGRVAMRVRFDTIAMSQRKRIAMWMARRARVA
jgi:hypothetical protein